MKDKTWKREVAVILLVFIGYISLFGDIEVLRILVTPIFLFAGGAFGLDAFAKQIQPSRSNKVQNGYD